MASKQKPQPYMIPLPKIETQIIKDKTLVVRMDGVEIGKMNKDQVSFQAITDLIIEMKKHLDQAAIKQAAMIAKEK